MHQHAPLLTQVLARSARALAAYAAADLLDLHPEAAAHCQSDPRAEWQDWLAERLNELSAAVAANDPSIFTRQVHWAAALFTSRGFVTGDIRSSLVCTREVLARELPASVRGLAVDYLDVALQSLEGGSADYPDPLSPTTSDRRLVAQYLLALFEGDRQQAKRLVFDALDEGRSVEDLFTQVLLPAQIEVGRMWHANEANVAEEHFTSETTKSIMAQLMARAKVRPRNGKTMLAAAVAGNHVDIGLQVVADLFELDGWRAIQLGANVPARDVARAVEYFKADLLGLSASQVTQLETVRETIATVRAGERGATVKIIVGGLAFAGSHHLPLQVGADGYASDAATAVDLGRQLVVRTTQQAAGPQPGPEPDLGSLKTASDTPPLEHTS